MLIDMHKMLVLQVKTLLFGSNFVEDIPLYQKILAALLTGKCSV